MNFPRPLSHKSRLILAPLCAATLVAAAFAFTPTPDLAPASRGNHSFPTVAGASTLPAPKPTSHAASAPADSYEAYIDSADNYSRKERWADAARCYRHALRLNPASPLNSKLFANLGVCHTRLGEYDNALDNFEIALIKEPRSASILTSRAATYILMADDSAALADLNLAIEIDSLSPTPRRMRGQILLMRADYPHAEVDFHTLSDLDPTDPWGPAGMGETALADSRYSEAIQHFTRAIEIADNPDFRISLISAMLDSNRLADAETSIIEALKLYPHTGEFYLLRAMLHKTLHQNSAAEIDCQLARQYGIDPQTIAKYLATPSK